jgi:hypothetical protein
MSRVTDLRSEVKSPVFTIGDWITVSRGRVVGIKNFRPDRVQLIIEGSATENRMRVAEVHAALISFALFHGREDLVSVGKIIQWWRRQRKSLRSQFYRSPPRTVRACRWPSTELGGRKAGETRLTYLVSL